MRKAEMMGRDSRLQRKPSLRAASPRYRSATKSDTWYHLAIQFCQEWGTTSIFSIQQTAMIEAHCIEQKYARGTWDRHTSCLLTLQGGHEEVYAMTVALTRFILASLLIVTVVYVARGINRSCGGQSPAYCSEMPTHNTRREV